jgi:hypothetical protein
MTLQDLLAQADNDGSLDQIAQQLGIDRDTARQGMAQLAPVVTRGLQRNAAQGPGIEDLLGSLLGGAGAGGGGGALGANGNDILGQIFGSKDVSRNVAGYASERSGLDSALLKRMLPLIASLAVGWLSQRGAQAADGGPITSGGLRGGRPGQAPAATSGSMLDSLNQMFDQDGDGSAVDDLLTMARKYF